MSLSIGQKVWVPCEVKRGPFSNERMVRVTSPAGQWFGFVSTAGLKDPVETGVTSVKAIILELLGAHLMLQVVGSAVTDTVYRDLVSRVSPVDPLQG